MSTSVLATALVWIKRNITCRWPTTFQRTGLPRLTWVWSKLPWWPLGRGQTDLRRSHWARCTSSVGPCTRLSALNRLSLTTSLSWLESNKYDMGYFWIFAKQLSYSSFFWTFRKKLKPDTKKNSSEFVKNLKNLQTFPQNSSQSKKLKESALQNSRN